MARWSVHLGRDTLKLLAGSWTVELLTHLDAGDFRPTELEHELDGIAHAALERRLNFPP